MTVMKRPNTTLLPKLGDLIFCGYKSQFDQNQQLLFVLEKYNIVEVYLTVSVNLEEKLTVICIDSLGSVYNGTKTYIHPSYVALHQIYSNIWIVTSV